MAKPKPNTPAFKKKRKEVTKLIFNFLDKVDPSGQSRDAFEKEESEMTDAKFASFMDSWDKDPGEGPDIEIRPGKEPKWEALRKLCSEMGVDPEQYVYYRHGIHTETHVRTPSKVIVVPVILKRLQQVLTKKNKTSTSISQRNPKTGQVSGDSKVGGIGIDQHNALLTMGADKAIEEFLGPRADNLEKKRRFYSDLSRNGAVSLNALPNTSTDKSTKILMDTILIGAGLKTDLVAPGLLLRTTLEGRERKKKPT